MIATGRLKRTVGALIASATGLALLALAPLQAGAGEGARASGGPVDALGVARSRAVTVAIAPAVDVEVAGPAGSARPIVVIDPGHGGHDPGAPGVSGTTNEKGLALALARELQARLVERGRVRVALTRTDDRFLSLGQRAAIARQLNAAAFVSLHFDSAANPLATGMSVYSLSDVASDAGAAQRARLENGREGSGEGPAASGVQALLDDLALRDRMEASAALAQRLLRKSSGRVALRPEPHRFAAFHVLRRAGVPAVLVEAGYISNPDEEGRLARPSERRALVDSLAQAIEADVAARTVARL